MLILSLIKENFRRLWLRRRADEEISRQVKMAYAAILGRKPDKEGLKSHSDNIISGRQTIGDVLTDMMNSEEYRKRDAALVFSLYRSILRREPDSAGLAHYQDKLNSGELGVIDIMNELLSSDEFSVKCLSHYNVAKATSKTILTSLTGRDPGHLAINSYADAFANGLTLEELLNQVKRSAEFVGGSSGSVEGSQSQVPVELATLAQDLIASRMSSEGSIIGLPPLAMVSSETISPLQLAALMRTLAMLGTNK